LGIEVVDGEEGKYYFGKGSSNWDVDLIAVSIIDDLWERGNGFDLFDGVDTFLGLFDLDKRSCDGSHCGLLISRIEKKCLRMTDVVLLWEVDVFRCWIYHEQRESGPFIHAILWSRILPRASLPWLDSETLTFSSQHGAMTASVCIIMSMVGGSEQLKLLPARISDMALLGSSGSP
jgi:hypothetical protein